MYREELRPTVLPATAVWQQRYKSPTKSTSGQWRAPLIHMGKPWALSCLSCRVDGVRRQNEEDSSLFHPAMAFQTHRISEASNLFWLNTIEIIEYE